MYKVYIAGKITGDPDYQIKFTAYEQAYISKGWTVLNPARLPSNMQPADYMRICLAMIDSADIVIFLPDYEESPGAMLEYSYCKYINKHTAFVSKENAKERITLNES